MGILAQALQEQEPETERKKSPFAQALEQVQPAAPVIQEKVQSGQSLSRTDLYNLGVDDRTNAKERKVITDALRRSGFRGHGATGSWDESTQSPFVAGGMGGFSPKIQQEDLAPMQTEANALAKRFGTHIKNETKRIAKTTISSPVSPVGVSEKDIQPFMQQAITEVEKQTKGMASAPEVMRQAKTLAAKLAAEKRLPETEIAPPATAGEYTTDIAAGLTTFIGELAIMRKVLPKGTPERIIWEVQNLLSGGKPGKGLLMHEVFAVPGRVIPGTGRASQVARVGAGAATMGGVTAAEQQLATGQINPVDVAVQTGVGAFFGVKGEIARAKALGIATKGLTEKAIREKVVKKEAELAQQQATPKVEPAPIEAEKPPVRPVEQRTAAEGGQIGQAATEGKQAWEMTYEEVRKAVSPSNAQELEASRPLLAKLYADKLENPADPWGIVRAVERGDEIPRTPTVDLSQRHRRVIEEAAKAGEKIPEQVLNEYPDLKAKLAQEALAAQPEAAKGEVEAQPLATKPVVAQKPEKVSDKAKLEPAPKRERQPAKPTKLQIETGETFGFTEKQVTDRLHKAQLRYEELRSKPPADLTTKQKGELDFLSHKRTDIQALIGRDIKPLSREALEARAKQYNIPTAGRTAKAILEDLQIRAEELRQRKTISNWKEWMKGEPVNVTPDKLLQFSLQHEAKGAKAGYRAGRIEALAEVKEQLHEAKIGRKQGYTQGQRDLVEKHKELLDFAKTTLPQGEYKLVANAAERALKSRTPSEMNKVVEAVNKMVANYEKASAVQSVKDAVKAAKKAKLRPEFQALVDEVEEGFALSKPKAETLKRLQKLLDAAQIEEHQIGDIPQRLVDRAKEILATAEALESGEKKLLRDMEPEELTAVSDAISNLIHQNQVKNELLFGREGRQAKEAIDQGTTAVKTRWGAKHAVEPGKYDTTGIRKRLQSGWNALKRITHWDQLNIQTKARLIAGRGNPVEQILAKNLNEGQNFVESVGNDATDFMLETLRSKGIDNKMLQQMSQTIGGKKAKPVKIALPEARGESGQRVETVEMTPAERIGFLRFIADPENRAAMLADQNKGIVFARDETAQAIKLRAADMKAIVDSAPQAEKDIARAMVDYVNGKAGRTVDISQRVKDVWLKLMGFPLKTHEDYVHRRRSGEHRDYDPTGTTQTYVERLLERMGVFKPRAKSNAPFVIGDAFGEFHADVNRMAAFAGKALAVHDAKRLLNDLQFRRSVKEAFKHGDALLTDLEKTVEFYQGLDQPFQGDVETLFRGILRRAHVGALAVKPHIVLYQTVSLLNAGAVGMNMKDLYNPGHFRRSEILRMRKLLVENSPTLNSRERGGSFQILTPASQGSTLKSLYGLEAKRLRSIHRADSDVIDLIGLAAEAEGKAKGLKGQELIDYTARRTEQVTLDSQPTWDATTLSSLAREGRSSVLKHLMVMFSSQRSKNFNMATDALTDYMFSGKTAADKAQLAKGVVIPTVANAFLIYGISEAYWFGLNSIAQLFGFNPKEPEKSWKSHLVGVMERMAGNWVIVGDLVSEAFVNLFKGLGGTPAQFKRERGTIMADALGQTMEAIVELGKFIGETAKDEKYKAGPKKGEPRNVDTFFRLLENSGRAAGIVTGLPIQGILQIATPFLPANQKAEQKTGTRKLRGTRK